MKKLDLFLLLLLLFTAFVLRLYKFESPIADRHSWRQVDTSSVSRIFAEEGFDILRPKFHDLSNVPSGKDNPEGYRFVEFPLYNLTQAGLYVLFGFFSLEQWGRLTTIFASLFSTLFIYLLVLKYSNKTSALFSALFFGILPFNVFYSRSILPDSAMVSAILGATYFVDVWLEKEKDKRFSIKKWVLFSIALVFAIEALLLKPYAIFFMLPIIYLAWYHLGFSFLKKWQLWLFLFLSIIPLILWRTWMQQFPQGIPANDWLYNKDNIRFKGAFFYHLFAERIARIILGYFGVGILICGFLQKINVKKMGFFLSFFVASFIYMSVFAGGNVQHDYYQIAIIPSLVIFLGLGTDFLLNSSREFTAKIMSYIVCSVCFLFMLMFGWYAVRDFYSVNPSIERAGDTVDQTIPKNARIIALQSGIGDTTFLYYTKRKGWASFEKDLPEMIKMGASYLAIVNPTEQDMGLANEYKVIIKTSDVVLFELKNQQ